jgi:hypothetical protein
MRGNSFSHPVLPGMGGDHPPILQVGLSVYVSSLALAASTGTRHFAIVDAINRLDVTLAYRLEHFRWSPDRRGIWISQAGLAGLAGLARPAKPRGESTRKAGICGFLINWLRNGWRGACKA